MSSKKAIVDGMASLFVFGQKDPQFVELVSALKKIYIAGYMDGADDYAGCDLDVENLYLAAIEAFERV